MDVQKSLKKNRIASNWRKLFCDMENCIKIGWKSEPGKWNESWNSIKYINHASPYI